MFTRTSKRACHGLLWLTAGLWLILEAWLTLDATFRLPLLRTLIGLFDPSPRLLTWLEWLKVTAWPFVSLVTIMVLREEAHRWFTGHGSCRIADRLTTAWFVFTGTLFTVDCLTTDVTVVWPIGAVHATIWLLCTRAASVVSRVLHAASRQKLRKVLRRWPIVHWLSTIAEFILPRLRMLKGVSPHAPSPQAHRHRRAR